MDADYLKQHVGPALAAALSEVVVKNPEDAIDFIGNFLIKFADDGEDAAKAPARAEATNTIISAQEKEAAEKAANEKAAADALAAQAADDDALFGELADAEKRFDGPEDGVVKAGLGPELRAKTAAVVQKVVDYVKSRTGAEACYMSSLRTMPEDAGGAQYLAFTTTTRESNFLKKMSLGAPEGDSEDPVPESGITFDLFAPEEEEEPPEVPEGEDPETWVPPVVYKPPPTVIVPNVLRDQRIKYFRFPRMGGYVASRIKYQNSVHDAALVEEHLTADPYPEPVEDGEAEEGEEESPAEAEAPAEGEAGADAEAEAPKKELRIWDATTEEATSVLAVDTMGTGRPFTEEEISFLQRSADALGAFLEKMTKHQYQAEVALHRARVAANEAAAAGAEEREAADAAALEQAMTGAAPAAEGEEGEATEAAEGEDAAPAEETAEELTDEQKAVKSAGIKQSQACTFLETSAGDLKNVLSHLISPGAAVVDALAACLEMAGMDLAVAKDPTTNVVSWEKLSQAADIDAAVAALKGMDGSAFDAEKTAALREKMGGLDADAASGFSYAVGALVKACGCVLDNCEATEVIRAAEEAARIAAEEEAAAAAAAAAEEEAGEAE